MLGLCLLGSKCLSHHKKEFRTLLHHVLEFAASNHVLVDSKLISLECGVTSTRSWCHWISYSLSRKQKHNERQDQSTKFNISLRQWWIPSLYNKGRKFKIGQILSTSCILSLLWISSQQWLKKLGTSVPHSTLKANTFDKKTLFSERLLIS